MKDLGIVSGYLEAELEQGGARRSAGGWQHGLELMQLAGENSQRARDANGLLLEALGNATGAAIFL